MSRASLLGLFLFIFCQFYIFVNSSQFLTIISKDKNKESAVDNDDKLIIPSFDEISTSQKVFLDDEGLIFLYIHYFFFFFLSRFE
jgi:hypothetical protein